MGVQLEITDGEIRKEMSGSNLLDPPEELSIGISSGEIKKCAELFDKYSRPDCAMFFVELLVTPSPDRAQKLLYFSSDLWKQLHSGALNGKMPSMFELDQFRADCKELSEYLVRISVVARQAPEPYCNEVNRWLGIYGQPSQPIKLN